MNFLTGQEREELKLYHRRDRDGRIRDRIKAVLLYDEGWTSKDIARVLLIFDVVGLRKSSQKTDPKG